MTHAKLTLDGTEYELPVVEGTEGEVGIDISTFRKASGAITLDPGYANTGSCESEITFIDGEKGILRYRGYEIADLAAGATFEGIAYLLIHGELPTEAQLSDFRAQLGDHLMLHENYKSLFSAYPVTAHPMAVLTANVAALSAYYDGEDGDLATLQLLAKMPSLVAYGYRRNRGLPLPTPRRDLGYTENFLNLMFEDPTGDGGMARSVGRALDMILILHADHEQNCSTSTVRMVGSSKANLFASVSAGISALWGPLHGGANQRVIEMLEQIRDDGGDYKKYVAMAKDKSSGFRLMGFGHRVYRNFDPRARILKQAANEVLETLGVNDPLLDIAKRLEEVALSDEYFIERKLYPNVDFYSGIVYRAMGIPTRMFTTLFALGRLPGWIAQWRELVADPRGRINRPRQIYTGLKARPFLALEDR